MYLMRLSVTLCHVLTVTFICLYRVCVICVGLFVCECVQYFHECLNPKAV